MNFDDCDSKLKLGKIDLIKLFRFVRNTGLVDSKLMVEWFLNRIGKDYIDNNQDYSKFFSFMQAWKNEKFEFIDGECVRIVKTVYSLDDLV